MIDKTVVKPEYLESSLERSRISLRNIAPIVNESVDKKIEYDDLQAYQEQQQAGSRALKKRFWQTSLYL